MARIYVSSTWSDLKEYREQVRLALRRLGHEDVAMEYYGAADERPVERCLRDVAAADLYIGIFAWRYGTVPAGQDKSITELEYRQAVASSKERLIFLVAEDAKWEFSRIELPAIDKIKALRADLSADRLVTYFTNADDLTAQVSQAVGNWQKRHGVKGQAALIDWEAYKQALLDKHQWLRLQVIAGASKDRGIAKIPLTDVFVPQLAEAGMPVFEISEEVLEYKRSIFRERMAKALDEEIPADEQLESTEEDQPNGEDEAALEATDGSLLAPSPEAVLSILARERTQVILGGPGSGKSTLMHYALLKICQPSASSSSTPPFLEQVRLPFLIELRQYVLKGLPDFLDYIAAHVKDYYGAALDIANLRELFGQSGQALVIFDGLDEVFDPAERSRVIQRFEAFARNYPQLKILVTSRIVGYDKTELGLAGFQHYTLLDFNLQQIRQFVPKWYEYYTLEGTERDARHLIQRIVESPRLMDLAGNPLLLTMMAVIYKHQDLPEQRWKLYERCTEVLLEDWELKRKNIRLEEQKLDIHIRAPQKAEILQRVSMYMLEHGQSGRELNAIAYQPLLELLTQYLAEKYNKSPGDAAAIGEGILNHLRERTYILAEIGERIFGFVHRTFMEYFAACQCRAEFNARKADYRWLTTELFGPRWHRDEWQEVLLLLIAMLADQNSPIDEIVAYLYKKCRQPIPFNTAFAARCLAEAGVIENPALAQRLLSELVESIATYAEQSRKREVQAFVDAALKAFGVLAPLVEVPQSAKDAIARLERSKVIRERMAAWQMGFALRSRAERLEFALAALNDKEEAVRRGAIAALEREWPGRREVGAALVQVVRNDRHGRVMQAALEALARAWPERTDVLDAIEQRFQNGLGYTFVVWIASYLGEHWAGNAKALVMLQEIVDWASERYLSEVVSTAISAIMGGWREHPEVMVWLRNQVLDGQEFKRVLALLAYAGFVPPANFPYFLFRHSFLMGDILEEATDLGSTWRLNPNILSFLWQQAAQATQEVRRFALRVIAKGWPDHPETRPLLIDRQTKETEPWIRDLIASLLRELDKRQSSASQPDTI